MMPFEMSLLNVTSYVKNCFVFNLLIALLFLLVIAPIGNQSVRLYLGRNFFPLIMLLHAEQFDDMIDHMLEKYFTFPLISTAHLDNIPCSLLDLQILQLPRFNFRIPRREGALVCVL
jgi:hypothetical protein